MRKIAALTSLVCLLAANAAAEDKPATSSINATVRVTAERGSPLLNIDLMRALRDERQVLRAIEKVAPDVELQSPVGDVVGVSIQPDYLAVPGVVAMNVELYSFDARIDAKALLEQLAELLERGLVDLDIEHKSNVESAEKERRHCQRLGADLSKDKQQFAKLCALAGVDADPAVASQKRLQSETQYQQLVVELTGVVARQAIIEQQIAKYGQQISKVEGSDAVILDELQKSVAARKTIVEFQQAAFNSGAAGGSVEKLEQAKDELAKAETELARHRRAVAAESGGRRIDELRERLDDTIIEREELLAKKMALSELRNQASNLTAQIDEKRIKLELRQQEYRERATEASKLNAKVQRHIPPSVEIVIDEPAPADQPAPEKSPEKTAP